MAKRAAAQAALEIVREEPPQRWPADKVSRRKTSGLVPYARNARTHSAEQISQVARSIEAFGWTTPVLIDESGMIIAGHARVLAAEQLGLDTVPTMVAAGWSEDQKRAYVLADNQLALNAGWDESILKLELGELQLAGFDLALTGFSLGELGGIFGGDGLGGDEAQGHGNLAERFGVAPFSVLNAREGWWQDRKRAWLALGIQSELGRGETEADASFKTQGAQRALQDGRPQRKANAIPGGGAAPLDRKRQGNPNATPGGGKVARG